MPELPDVEGYRRRFSRHGRGKRLRKVLVLAPSIIRNASAARLVRALEGRRFGPPARHGKWLVAPAGGPVLLIHFGMTGELLWSASRERPHRDDRVLLMFDRGALRFRDPRKFGGLWLARGPEQARALLAKLGPDASRIGRGEFVERLGRRRGALKPALMDQRLVAGLGNMLVDEILWQARLSPAARVDALDAGALSRLYRVMRRVLAVSVRHARVPVRSDWLTGARGRRDARCPRCGLPFSRGEHGGRSSYFCRRCQPVRRT